ncbi:MAG TPA: NUDIX hydrolase [Candidatus Saccharimonadales bacterium]
MKTIARRAGIFAFWVTYPALMVYLSRTPRTRILLRSQGKILAVQSWLGDGRWHLPGGGLHKGEAPLAGVLRETREETGIELPANSVRLWFTEDYRHRGVHFPCHYFIADLPELAALTPQPLEISEVAWLDPAELSAHNASPDIITAFAHLSTKNDRDNLLQ